MERIDREKIKREATELLEKFAKSLDKIKNKVREDFFLERNEFERKEGGKNCKEFKEKLLANAPQKNDDFIIAEKGAWK